MSSNRGYWRKRFEQVTKRELDKSDKYQAALEREYDKASAQLQKDIEAWYTRFASDNKVTYAEAKRLLNSKELEELRWTVEDYIKYGESNSLDGKWLKQLKNASAKVHISRLEALQLQLQQHAEVVFGNQLDDLDGVLRNIYESGYYHSIFEVQKGIGIGSSFVKLDTNRIDKVLATPWTDDGIEFSSRIWTNRSKLVHSLRTGLTQSLIRGESPDKLSKQLANQFNVSKDRALSLVETESAHIANAAQQDCFAELDVNKLEIIGTLDSHTCSVCADMDGMMIDLKDAKSGISTPPYHPRCRCCTAPAVDESIGERAARGEDGQMYDVPADMTYSRWYDMHVKGASAGSGGDGTKSLPQKVGRVEFADKKAVMAKLQDFEKSAIDLDYERNISICKDGSVWVTDGSSANVYPGILETVVNGTTLKGSYSYHNHPRNETYCSFSYDDVAFFIAYGEQLSMASDYKYEYFMQRIDDTVDMAYDDIKSKFENAYKTIALQKSIDEGLDIDEHGYHIAVKQLAKELHFKYWRIKK